MGDRRVTNQRHAIYLEVSRKSTVKDDHLIMDAVTKKYGNKMMFIKLTDDLDGGEYIVKDVSFNDAFERIMNMNEEEYYLYKELNNISYGKA